MFDKLITSSADPAKLSATVRGVLMAVVPLVIAFTGANEAEIQAIVDAVVDLVFYGTALWSAGLVLFGLVRKVQLGRWSALD